MAEILQGYTIVRRLLPPESIPWPQLVLPSAIEKLRERYKFEVVERQPAQKDTKEALVCRDGEIILNNIPQAVQLLAFEPNLVQSQTTGGSEIADALFSDIEDLIHQLDPSRKIGSAYIKTYQTIAVAKLSVPFSSIFSEKFKQYLEETVAPTLSLSDARADISPSHMAFRVKFNTEKSDFVYSPKVLMIEPRSGSKLTDCIYYTQSPTDPETHKHLLEKFEDSLS